MSNLALVYDEKDNDEINKLNEFCRYENISIDYYLREKKFQIISDFIDCFANIAHLYIKRVLFTTHVVLFRNKIPEGSASTSSLLL